MWKRLTNCWSSCDLGDPLAAVVAKITAARRRSHDIAILDLKHLLNGIAAHWIEQYRTKKAVPASF